MFSVHEFWFKTVEKYQLENGAMNKGGRRLRKDRRENNFKVSIDRRAGSERRIKIDRRGGVERRSPLGFRAMIGQDRRISFSS